MRIEFDDDDLRRLYEEPESHHPRYGSDIVKQLRKKVGYVQSARDERDLYEYKALHFEKLDGDRAGQNSIRLNRQWRLILELRTDDQGTLVAIISITDYH